jgi:hypothetical protein
MYSKQLQSFYEKLNFSENNVQKKVIKTIIIINIIVISIIFTSIIMNVIVIIIIIINFRIQMDVRFFYKEFKKIADIKEYPKDLKLFVTQKINEANNI